MLGQLAINIRVQAHLQDQEVFLLGYHGDRVHIVRGYFSKERIARVLAKGFSDKEVFELGFSRGWDLCRKEDWLEVMRGLTRLLRYLMSGEAMVGALQVLLQDGAETDV
ncbi:hypothetical protein BO94DRAFT_531523 [Aspergillus sclerotioniger CBS 115572]|uniref:Uncharacterized protein n=1 Tax=Aspergillus sclerotioniger CBS 115572 TaxID=1450535 RepID=A0A317XC89_9EURO|nr:hypothetical protein BO94DRAFT_531523 [Aspergillus sclerotioniger CBS 115572]PWY94578.1 hypothetical protein BO94DRAFT_531523 [Aspergillus sclerotioniger CBS 115572]